MPIRPVAYTPQPYVRNTATLGQLLGLRAATSGQMWADLGRTISGGLQQYATERREAPIRAQQDEIRRLQLEDAQAQAEGRKQLSVRDQAIQDYMTSEEFAAAPNDVRLRELTRRGGPDYGPKKFKEWFDAQQAPIIAENAAADRARGIETADREWRRNLNKDGVAEMDRLADNALAQQTATDAAARHNRAQEAAAWAAASRTNAQEPLEKIVGPDGKVVFVPRSQAIGKTPGAGTEKSSTGVQKRVLNFFNRADQADKDLQALEPEIEKLSLPGQARQAWAPNFLQSQLGQSYTAAQRAFTEARLRKDSGAAIPPHEFDSDRKTYFVQPGDSKQTIQDKNRARAAMLASLAFESGQALGEYVGDAEEARKMIDGYKTRAAKTAGKGTIGRFQVEVEP
jgi:hypothetical protein